MWLFSGALAGGRVLWLGDGGLSAGEIAERFAISKWSISYHLDMLKDAGLVTAEKKGQFVIYSLNMTVFHEIAAWLLDYRAKGEVDREDKER
ncbi:MAG: helix-turn-helix domain-containing protein [Firmicutes bacterium]|nr:helix-turn-helix domain-containing protein [Bacillota bacterium]